MGLTPEENAVGKEDISTEDGQTRRRFLKKGLAAGAGLGAMYFGDGDSLNRPLHAGEIGETNPQHAVPNAIVRENQQPGTREWLLTKTDVDQDQRSRAIEGYCSHTSIRTGEELNVYVSMNPPGAFKLDVYRLGYYGGDGARQVLSLGPHEANTQPDPEPGEREVRECRWEPAVQIQIPADWLSGVYLGKLTAEPQGVQSYIIFIVRDDRQADFLFQCSDFTWQAYNRWPQWASLYDYQGNRWETKESNDISFDRPYGRFLNGLPAKPEDVTRYVGAGEFLLWEYPLAFWMEQHGYDVTYISNLDTHTDADGLRRARGFLSVGHDEYWTDQMFRNVVEARDAGVNLAFLSGNSVYFAVDLDDSRDGRPHRIVRRDHRFDSEQSLLGAMSYGVGLGDWTCRQPDHWVFAETGMQRGDSIEGLVGWEFHGPPLKDDPSLVVLARDTVHNPYSSGKPKEYAGTIYDGPQGNFVFNAATCWWNVPLSSPPGAFYPNEATLPTEDERVRQITHNLLRRMQQPLRGDAP